MATKRSVAISDAAHDALTKKRAEFGALAPNINNLVELAIIEGLKRIKPPHVDASDLDQQEQ